MRVESWKAFLSGGKAAGGYAASIGSFDGVHLGHRRLLETLASRSRERGIRCLVITFRENPKRILRPERFKGDISSLEQRLERISAAGAELCVLIDYDEKFGSLTGAGFLDLLEEETGLAFLAMGQNARIGSQAAMDSAHAVDYAKGIGIDAEIVPSLVLEGKAVSSSRIRGAVEEGNVAEAAELLGYPFEWDLSAWTARGKGSRLQLIAPPRGQISPPDGLYAAECLGSRGALARGELEISEGGALMLLSGADVLPSRLRFV